MVAPTQGQRNLKNAYRKKGFQTPTLNKVTVNPTAACGQLRTTSTAFASVHHKGLTSPVQQRPVSQGSVMRLFRSAP